MKSITLMAAVKSIFLVVFWGLFSNLSAQITEECRLKFGTNLGGLADYGTELPFVDLMHNARVWYTKDIGNPNAAFDSGHAKDLTYRPDGYPTHVPQSIENSDYDQEVVTIWAITDGWPAGQYTVLWEGTGTLFFWGSYQNLTQTGDHRITFDFPQPVGGILEMTIEASDINDPIHHIRVLMPGTEATYETQPFYSLWLEKLSIFPSVRFMDWGATNNWGQEADEPWEHNTLFDWQDRARMDHYTWADGKGIPYEMMIQLMNDIELDGWVCVPHRASNEYIQKMAELFKNNLDDDRHLTVEYSNEIWNWIFAQTHWLNVNGCENQGISWPEGIVPYVQNCLDIWTDVYQGQLDKITRVAGVQASWQDVSNRIVNNLTPGSFDAVSPTFYFGLTDEGDAALDALGEAATVSDIAFYARQGMEAAKVDLITQKDELADPLGVPLVFYEGGQHLTGHPFGELPTYSEALLAIHRDTAMYNLYNEWFDFLTTLQAGDAPIQLMNFSFTAGLNAQYGSWGILESLNQDTSLIPAPKYRAIAERIEACRLSTDVVDPGNAPANHTLFPNPTTGVFTIGGDLKDCSIEIFDIRGQWQKSIKAQPKTEGEINVANLINGLYYVKITDRETGENDWVKFVLVK